MSRFARTGRDVGEVAMRKHVVAWQQSGVSQRSYCREKRLSVGSFRHFITKMESEREKIEEKKELKLVPVKVIKDEQAETVRKEKSSSLKLVISERFEIELSNDFSSEALSRLIDVLETK